MGACKNVHKELKALGLYIIENAVENYLNNAKDKSIIAIIDHIFHQRR